MKIYTLGEGKAGVDLHHDGTVDLSMIYDGTKLRIPPEDLEDVASLLAMTAARSERMHYDIGAFPSRCPFRKGEGLGYGARCVLEVHGDSEHVF